MKKRLIWLVFLLLLPVVVAKNWMYDSEYTDLHLDVSSKINLVSTGSRYNVEYVIAELSFVPQKSFQQEILDISTNPTAVVENGVATYRWDNPGERELDFRLVSNVRTFNKITQVRNKIRFPLTNLPNEVLDYTRPSETADSENPEIIRKASELVAGEDDLYVVVFNLGDWVKRNIEYDLGTLTESVSQSASWVLTNKYGVCDELTNLFIAMSRSLGIPVKFVSGVAYTNAEQFGEGFGPHGWAEVYFPGYGWVPFDVTYGEYGFVDAGHIKLKESIDATDASTRFQWLGKDVKTETSQLEVDVDIKESKGRVSDFISLDSSALKNNIGFGSYNLIEATVKNLKDYYVGTELRLSKTKETEVIGDNKQNILLKPGEEKKVKWILKVSDNLEQGYIYTFPLVVSSSRNFTSTASFDVIENGKQFSLEGIESLAGVGDEEKSFSTNVGISCAADDNEIYNYQSTIVRCTVTNIGNVYLEDLNVCLLEDCEKISLGITQSDSLEFEFTPEEVGVQQIVVKVKNNEVTKNAFFDITVYDRPVLEISDLSYPQTVGYDDMYNLSFILNKKSKFPAQEVIITVLPVKKEWTLDHLSEDRKFVLRMYGSELDLGVNEFEIFIKYSDKNQGEYETSEQFNISLTDVTFGQRIAIFFKSIGRKVVGIFEK